MAVYCRRLVEQIRERCKQSKYQIDTATGTFTAAASHDLILSFLNDGQDRLQSKIIDQHPSTFQVEQTINLAANTESYSISDNVFIGAKLLQVEFSPTGQPRDYYPIDQKHIRDRESRRVSTESPIYILRGNNILINPIPSSTMGSLRVTYYRALDRLDFRQMKISSTTGTPITKLNGSAVAENSDTIKSMDDANVYEGDYVCVCDKDGNVTAYSIPITGGDSSAPEYDVDSHTLSTGESIDAGSFVTRGKFSSTHTSLPEPGERFLKLYAQFRLLSYLSNKDLAQEREEMLEAERDAVSSYAQQSADLEHIPVVDEELFT